MKVRLKILLVAMLVGLGLVAAAPPASAATWHYVQVYSYSSGSTGTTSYFHQSADRDFYSPGWYAYVALTCRAGGWLNVEFDSDKTSTVWAHPQWSLSAYDTVYWSKTSTTDNLINYNANSNGCSWNVRFYQEVYG